LFKAIEKNWKMNSKGLNITLPKTSNPDEDEAADQPNRILLIGAGQMGSRFLQGIALMPATFSFHVVDGNESHPMLKLE